MQRVQGKRLHRVRLAGDYKGDTGFRRQALQRFSNRNAAFAGQINIQKCQVKGRLFPRRVQQRCAVKIALRLTGRSQPCSASINCRCSCSLSSQNAIRKKNTSFPTCIVLRGFANQCRSMQRFLLYSIPYFLQWRTTIRSDISRHSYQKNGSVNH